MLLDMLYIDNIRIFTVVFEVLKRSITNLIILGLMLVLQLRKQLDDLFGRFCQVWFKIGDHGSDLCGQLLPIFELSVYVLIFDLDLAVRFFERLMVLHDLLNSAEQIKHHFESLFDAGGRVSHVVDHHIQKDFGGFEFLIEDI